VSTKLEKVDYLKRLVSIDDKVNTDYFDIDIDFFDVTPKELKNASKYSTFGAIKHEGRVLYSRK